MSDDWSDGWDDWSDGSEDSSSDTDRWDDRIDELIETTNDLLYLDDMDAMDEGYSTAEERDESEAYKGLYPADYDNSWRESDLDEEDVSRLNASGVAGGSYRHISEHAAAEQQVSAAEKANIGASSQTVSSAEDDKYFKLKQFFFGLCLGGSLFVGLGLYIFAPDDCPGLEIAGIIMANSWIAVFSIMHMIYKKKKSRQDDK